MTIRRTRRVFRRSVVRSFVLLASIAGTAQLAYAQNQTPNQTSEEIIVTGSRVSHQGFDSAQPLTTIDNEQIQNLGIVNTGDVLRKLPQNTPFFTETNVGIGNFNVGAQLANLRGLNPFFGTRTLTLVDTKRVVPQSEGGAVDLTLIPSMLVSRTEVVTGGASAAYGSDAIAGVVNVILDKKLEGFKAQLDYGETSGGDGGDTHGSFAWGSAFGGNDRGHVIAGIEYQKQDTIGPCSQTRDWCKDAWLIGNNTTFATGGSGTLVGYPNFYVAPGGKQTPSQNGTITPCTNAACTTNGAPLQFNADGTALSPFNPGLPASGFAARIGGDGTQLAYDTSNIRPEVERYSALGRVSYDISDKFRWYAELAYAHSDSSNTPANGGLGPGPLRIQADNAFLTPGVSAQLGAFGGNLNRIFMPAVMSANNTTENTTTRFVTGFDSEIGTKWNWDAYFQHGENENHQRLFHNMVGSLSGPAVRQYDFLRWALDAVHSNPADPTSPIVCRATKVGDPTFSPLAAGCVPLDIMGNGHASQAAIDYAFRTLKEDADYKQDVVGVNFRSNIAQGWAGPIAFATGLEWRSDKDTTTHDIPNQPWYSSYFLSYGLDRGGTIDVLEGYGEVQVPMSKKLQTDFALRETHNEASSSTASNVSGSHDFSSWKASAIYDPLQWLRVRATVSRDVRAAGFRELFLPRVTVQSGVFPANVTNPWAGGASDQFLQTTGGYPGLKPETADTYTIGTVFSFEKLRFSVDWFKIDLQDAITQSPGNQPLVDQCFRSGGGACDRVTGHGTADITAIDSSAINLAGFLTQGWDYEVTYAVPMHGGGNLNLRFIGTYLYDMIVDTGLGAAPIDYAGQSGPVASFGSFNTQPKWQARAFVTWQRQKFTTTFEAVYVGSGTLNATWFTAPIGSAAARLPFSVTDNNVSDAYYLNWSGSYDLGGKEGKGTQIFWAVNNLLDKNPPVAPGGNAYPTNPVFFDTLGQRIRLGVRFNF
jgi:iron complex outermembrane recepter protein